MNSTFQGFTEVPVTPGLHARVTVFANHKGGVGKSFFVLLFAAELAQRGYKVLVVDLDPQGNCSRRMGYSEFELEERVTIDDALGEPTPAKAADTARDAIVPCQWDPAWADNIHLLPSKIELENRVAEAGVPGSWKRLNNAIAPLRENYHYILIDTPPTMGHLLHLALVAANDVILPATPTYDAVRGAQRLQEYMEDPDNRSALGMNARIIGVIMNGQRTRVASHQERLDAAIADWSDLVWQPPVPLRAQLEVTQEFAEPPHLAMPREVRDLITDTARALIDRYLKEAA